MSASRTVRGGAIVGVPVALLLALDGCAGAPAAAPDPAGPAGPPGPVETADGTSGGDTECVIGTWALDVEDYRAQAEAYLLSLSIPLESLELVGSLTVGFTPIYFDVSSALTTNAVVHGVPLSEPGEYSGGADWGWEADDASTVSFDAWAWGVEPATSSDGFAAPALVEPGSLMSVECAGDELTLRSAGAPLVGHFTRIG